MLYFLLLTHYCASLKNQVPIVTIRNWHMNDGNVWEKHLHNPQQATKTLNPQLDLRLWTDGKINRLLEITRDLYQMFSYYPLKHTQAHFPGLLPWEIWLKSKLRPAPENINRHFALVGDGRTSSVTLGFLELTFFTYSLKLRTVRCCLQEWSEIPSRPSIK